MDAIKLLFALLAVCPHCPREAAIRRAAEHIAETADDAEESYGVPAGILVTIAFLETHIGTDAGEGGGWGAPTDARHRNVAGTAFNSAHILATGFATCHTWFRAITYYRSGHCVFGHLVGYEAPYAVGLIERIYDRAGIDRPERLR